MTRRATMLPIAALALLGLATLGVANLADVQADRPDCPGKIVCPQTGERVCRDQCPTVDANRWDCPGRIVCPLTGNLVCKDRCPLDKKAASETPESNLPACCVTKD